jgi:serine/threonine protein kinase
MAPEQAAAQNRQIGSMTDVYALGTILYETITGQPPFRGVTVAQILTQVQTQEPLSPTRLQRTVPRDLETICLKAMAKQPERRYSSASHLADDLGRFLKREPIQAHPVSAPARAWRWCRRNSMVAGLLLAVFTSLLMGAGVSISYGLQASRREKDAIKSAEDATDAKNRAAQDANAARKSAATARKSEKQARDENLMSRRHLYDAQMSLAQRAWENARIRSLDVLLNRQRSHQESRNDLRGFEWH